MTRLTFTIEADTAPGLIAELERMTSAVKKEMASAPPPPPPPPSSTKGGDKEKVVELKPKSGNGQTRRGKAKVEPPKDPEPEEEEEEEEDEDPEEEDEENEDELSLPEVISKLTAAYQGGDKTLKDKIIEFRKKMGVNLLRELKEKQLPEAIKFMAELDAM